VKAEYHVDQRDATAATHGATSQILARMMLHAKKKHAAAVAKNPDERRASALSYTLPLATRSRGPGRFRVDDYYMDS